MAQSGQKVLSAKGKAKLVVNNENVELSSAVARMPARTFSYIAKGKSVVITPEPTEFSTQQAADFLKVSRPFLIKLLETGEITFRKVGKHRRVRFEDLLSFKQRIDEKRLKILAKLAEQAQELDLVY